MRRHRGSRPTVGIDGALRLAGIRLVSVRRRGRMGLRVLALRGTPDSGRHSSARYDTRTRHPPRVGVRNLSEQKLYFRPHRGHA